MGLTFRQRTDKGKLVVHLLVVTFGITSWSILNGLWVELPILVAHLPEGWTLPSYLTIISQLGNVGPIAFSFLVYLTPNRKLETPACIVIVTVLTLCALLYSFFWSQTAIVAGQDFSVALLSLTFCQAVFAATTSIAYLAFMAHLRAQYMGSIFIGMSLSGLIPAFAAIGQGSGDVRCVTNVSIHNNATPGLATIFPVDTTLRDGEFDYMSPFNWTTRFTPNVTSSELPEAGRSNGPLYDVNTTNTIRGTSVQAYNVEPVFSVQGFFLLLTALGALSFFSLLMLLCHPYCTAEHVDSDQEENCQLMTRDSKQQTLTKAQAEDEPSTPSCVLYNDSNIQLSTNSGVPNSGNMPKISSATKDSLSPVVDDALLESPVLYPVLSTKPTEPESSDSSRDPLKPESNSLGVETTVAFQSSPTKSSRVDENNVSLHAGDTQSLKPADDELNGSGNDVESEHRGTTASSKLELWFLLGLLVWINVIQTSFVLAIQVYSSLPYGLFYYNGVAKAENIVDPVACFLTMWMTTKSTRVISGLTLLGTLFSAYIIALAAMSPSPILVHHTAGGILVIVAWVISTMINIFTKVTIASVMRGHGRISLMWAGGSTQLGALIGAILAYVMVNQLHLFKDSPWCA
ncbi:unnamed protein product [Lymnaea stagnalis]|uniref:Uncharacterized protein n=1 Tax=Lymnaea stagnalis TaxID=6523 RepID=A0AAV2I1R7_LYMST